MTQEFTVSHRNVATIQHDVDFAVVNLLSRDQRIRGALDNKARTSQKCGLFIGKALENKRLGDCFASSFRRFTTS